MMVTREKQLSNNLHLPLEQRIVTQCGIRCSDGRVRFSWGTLSSFLIGGQPQQGKSVILAFMAGQAVLAGSSLVVFDPHCQIKSRGLMAKIEPLSDWFLAAPRDFSNIDEVVGHFAWLDQECRRRQSPGGLEGKQPIFTIIDEFNGLFTRLSKEQTKIVANALGEIARAGPKMGLFLIIAAHQWQLSKTGGGDIRKNIPCRISVKSELGELAMTMDMQRETLRPYTEPTMRPGDALIYTPLLDVRRCVFPNTTAGDNEEIARVRRRSEEKYTFASAERTETEIEGIKPEEGRKALAKGAPNKPNVKPNTPNIVPRERTLIIAAGNRQLMETGKVVRRKLHDTMKAQISGWDSDDYWKIQAVCDELGWHRNMSQGMTDEQWEGLKRLYNYTCLSCGKREPDVQLEPDHVVPRSRGGSDDVSNRQPLCRDCNNRKLTKSTDYRAGRSQYA